MVAAKDEFWQTKLPRSLVNGIIVQNAEGLWQTRVKIGRLHSVIYNGHVTGLCLCAQEFAGFRDGSGIVPPEVAHIGQKSCAKKTLGNFGGYMCADRVVAEPKKALRICCNPRRQLRQLRESENNEEREPDEQVTATDLRNRDPGSHGRAW